MSKLERIYTISNIESRKLGIPTSQGDYQKWLQEKRKLRRTAKQALKNAIKSELC